jgi:hypothetical protein
MSFISNEEVKKILQITDASKDDAIDLLIPAVQDFIKTYCNNSFLNSEGAESFPDGLKLPVAKMIGIDLNKKILSGTQSESLGDHSISFTGDYPASILKTLNHYRKVKFI